MAIHGHGSSAVTASTPTTKGEGRLLCAEGRDALRRFGAQITADEWEDAQDEAQILVEVGERLERLACHKAAVRKREAREAT